jgi:molecular chaperone IbpA
LFQSSIGFDHLFDLFEDTTRVQPAESWPPYDIEKTGEDRYCIRMAVAGFPAESLDVTVHPNLLIVSGKNTSKGDGAEMLYRGIATRNFERRFQLADYVEVARADLADGLLTIDLVRNVPEAMKPRRISLKGGSGAGRKPQQLDEKQAA